MEVVAALEQHERAARIRLSEEPGRTIVFLEGGYELHALRDSVTATVSTLLGTPVRPEPATSGGPGVSAVRAVRELHLP